MQTPPALSLRQASLLPVEHAVPYPHVGRCGWDWAGRMSAWKSRSYSCCPLRCTGAGAAPEAVRQVRKEVCQARVRRRGRRRERAVLLACVHAHPGAPPVPHFRVPRTPPPYRPCTRLGWGLLHACFAGPCNQGSASSVCLCTYESFVASR